MRNPCLTPGIRLCALAALAATLAPGSLPAQDPTGRVPGDTWMQFVDVAEAGFDAEALEAARQTWESLPSSAFMVISDGAAGGSTDVGVRAQTTNIVLPTPTTVLWPSDSLTIWIILMPCVLLVMNQSLVLKSRWPWDPFSPASIRVFLEGRIQSS